MIGVIVLGALALRLFRIGATSFWIDEINVLSSVRSGHLLTDIRNHGGPFEPPLHYVAVWATSWLPIGFEAAARIPAALFGTLEVLTLGLFARSVTRRRDVALLAAGFLAVAPFAVRYSQENRYYTTFSALHLLSWWLLVRAVQTRTRSAFLWWGVAVALLVLAHPFAPLVVAIQVGVLAWIARREHRTGDPTEARRLVQLGVRSIAVALALVAPWYLWGSLRWIPDLWHGHSYQLNRGQRPQVSLDIDLMKRAGQWLLGNGGRWTVLSTLLALLIVTSIVLARGPLRSATFAVAAYVGAFFVALVPLAHLLNTYLAMRRIEFLLPPALLLAAIGSVVVVERVGVRFGTTPFPARRTLVGIVGTVVFMSLVVVVVYYRSEKTNYRALAHVLSQTPKNDLIVVGPIDRRWPQPIETYLGWRHVHRRLHYVISGDRPPHLDVPRGRVVWVTGGPPGGKAFRTRALNSVRDLQVIAGDRSTPGAILPWYVSVSTPKTAPELHHQLSKIVDLPVLLPPPRSTFPWWVVTAR